MSMALAAGGRTGLVAEIVLTGGPASGKSASLGFLAASLDARGYRALLVPELATMVYTGGVPDVGRIAVEERELYAAIQGVMFFEMQHAIRGYYQRLAAKFKQPVIIIYDRAEMDVAAYLSTEEFLAAVQESGLTVSEVRDSYDAVIHLTTAAGTPYADLFGNRGRREADDAEAVAADERTWTAWSAHPHHYRVSSHASFDVKLGQVLAAIFETVARKTT